MPLSHFSHPRINQPEPCLASESRPWDQAIPVGIVDCRLDHKVDVCQSFTPSALTTLCQWANTIFLAFAWLFGCHWDLGPSVWKSRTQWQLDMQKYHPRPVRYTMEHKQTLTLCSASSFPLTSADSKLQTTQVFNDHLCFFSSKDPVSAPTLAVCVTGWELGIVALPCASGFSHC